MKDKGVGGQKTRLRIPLLEGVGVMQDKKLQFEEIQVVGTGRVRTHSAISTLDQIHLDT